MRYEIKSLTSPDGTPVHTVVEFEDDGTPRGGDKHWLALDHAIKAKVAYENGLSVHPRYNPPTTNLDKATLAIGVLYASWEIHGGVGPDTRDESREVQRAVGAGKVVPDETFEAIWEAASDGAELAQIAQLHLDALGVKA